MIDLNSSISNKNHGKSQSKTDNERRIPEIQEPDQQIREGIQEEKPCETQGRIKSLNESNIKGSAKMTNTFIFLLTKELSAFQYLMMLDFCMFGMDLMLL